jgi:hypothetical protein
MRYFKDEKMRLLAIAEDRSGQEINKAAEDAMILNAAFEARLRTFAPEFPLIRPEGIPEPVYRALRSYLADRQPVGHFVTAVLHNNLHEALAKADVVNLESLPIIVQFVYWSLPGNAWGSPERVSNWLNYYEKSA